MHAFRSATRLVALARGLPFFEPDLIGQAVRFVLVGGTVAVVYLCTTTVLAVVVRVPFQVALAIGFSLALAVHFTLQRVFVWAPHGEFALPFHRQAGRYLLVSGAQYGVTVASTSLLPDALGVSTEVVYLITVLLAGSVNFLVFRYGVFHAGTADPAPRLTPKTD
ncbi:MAG TPA: GtrA family protein [Solirubrobacteraceae bacterium]|jgi:putative flippase GtrA